MLAFISEVMKKHHANAFDLNFPFLLLLVLLLLLRRPKNNRKKKYRGFTAIAKLHFAKSCSTQVA